MTKSERAAIRVRLMSRIAHTKLVLERTTRLDTRLRYEGRLAAYRNALRWIGGGA